MTVSVCSPNLKNALLDIWQRYKENPRMNPKAAQMTQPRMEAVVKVTILQTSYNIVFIKLRKGIETFMLI